MNEELITATHLSKSFPLPGRGREPVRVLREVSLRVDAGEMVAIVGPSGSGKSTLMHCLVGLEPPTGGTVRVLGHELAGLGRGRLARLRREGIGFIFQDLNLIESLPVAGNTALPARLGRRAVSRAAVDAALEAVGLTGYGARLPARLSGGERQRVALARVLLCDPAVVFADEPTGSLDTDSGHRVLDLLRSRPGPGRAVVLVTHDLDAAARADRVLLMRDGFLAGELFSPDAGTILAALRSPVGGAAA